MLSRCNTELPSYAKICPNCFYVLDQAIAIKATIGMDIDLDKEQSKPGFLTGTIKNYDDLKPMLLMISEMQKTIEELKQQVKAK